MRKLVLLLWVVAVVSGDGERSNAEYGASYKGEVGNGSGTTELVFPTPPRGEVVRLWVHSSDANSRHPALVVVRQPQAVLSCQLPYQLQPNHSYPQVARTLCPLQDQQNGSVIVELSSFSPTPVAYNLTASLLTPTNFSLELGKPHKVVDLSPSEPQIFHFSFAQVPSHVKSVLVQARSYDDFCAVISIQPVGCPVYDEDANVNFVGTYQTLTGSAAIPIRRDLLEEFFVVLVVRGSDESCGEMKKLKPSNRATPLSRVKAESRRVKQVMLLVREGRAELSAAVGLTVGALAGIYLVALAVSLWMNARDSNELRRAVERLGAEASAEGKGLMAGSGENGSRYGTLDAAVSGNLTNDDAPTSSSANSPLLDDSATTAEVGTSVAARGSVNPAVDEITGSMDEYDTLPDADLDKKVIRAKRDLKVSDLAMKSYKARDKKYRLYHWNLLTISIFYVLPVIQLVLAYQAAVFKSGNEDLCYYNFLCATPLGGLFAFNNVFSNLGYVLLGILFLLLVRRRHVTYQRVRATLPDGMGLPRHFGLHYAIGLSLVMEGILSGCYHVCPNYSNFQFDTAFMYMLGALGMLQLYQMRHPDINASSHVAYALMAGMILLSVVGVVANGILFWILFSAFYALLMVLIGIQFYYKGQWKLGRGFTARVAQDWRGSCSPRDGLPAFFRPAYPDRLVFLLLGLLLNGAFLGLGLARQPADFDTFLLTVFISNLLAYVVYYLLMKLRHGERLGGRPLVCMGLGAAAWSAALYFYFSAATDWTQSAALSRVQNQECVLLGFYDSHDVWHFVSALSLFLSFLLLLVVDDDLTYKLAADIPVF